MSHLSVFLSIGHFTEVWAANEYKITKIDINKCNFNLLVILKRILKKA